MTDQTQPQIEYLPPEGTPRSAGSGEKWLTFSPTACRAALELIALGKSIFEIETEPNMPPAQTFIQWVMVYPGVARAYATARELSGFMLEEEALFVSRQIAKGNYNSVQIKAQEVLLNQLRWSAGKRNPQVFSDKAALKITVPIQINTTLDMGSISDESTEQFPNIYEMTAELEQEVPLDEVPLDTLKGDPKQAARGKDRAPARKARSHAGASAEAEAVPQEDVRDDGRGAGAPRSAPRTRSRSHQSRAGASRAGAEDAQVTDKEAE